MSTITCPVCHTKYIQAGGRLRNRGEYNHSVDSASVNVGPGEWLQRTLTAQEAMARFSLALPLAVGATVLTALPMDWLGWPSWSWQAFTGVFVLVGGTLYVVFIRSFFEREPAALQVKGKYEELQQDVPPQQTHKVKAIVRNEDTGHEDWLEYDVSDWRAMVTFCKSIISAGKNFSEAEAKRHGLTAVDWHGIIDEFKRRRLVNRATIGKGRTLVLYDAGVAIIKAIADTPTA